MTSKTCTVGVVLRIWNSKPRCSQVERQLTKHVFAKKRKKEKKLNLQDHTEVRGHGKPSLTAHEERIRTRR